MTSIIIQPDDYRLLKISSTRPNKKALLQTYMKLFYKLPSLTFTVSRTDPLRDVDTSHPFEFKNIKFVAGNYQFVPHQSYVIFGNRRLGGGVLRDGNVQEEFILTQTPLLPYLKDSRLKTVSEMTKSSGSLILDTHIVFDICPDLYGQGLHKMGIDDVSDNIKFIEPIPVLMVTMEAPKNPCYTKAMLLNMLQRCYISFEGLLKYHRQKYPDEPFILHTGMWGCGAYNNDPMVVVSVQTYAWSLLKSETKGKMKLVYHMSDKIQYKEEFKSWMTKMDEMTFDQICDEMIKQGNF